MEKQSNKTLCSTEGTTVHQEDPCKTDSNDSVELDRPRKGSHLAVVADPQRKFTMPASGLTARRRGMTFMPVAKHHLSPWLWKSHKGLVYGLSSSNIKNSTKIALFDMDGTLIVNKTGRRQTDWEFFHPSIPEKLKELYSTGFRIVIASNQLGISLNLVSEKDIQKKVESFVAAIGVEATVMLATKNDKFRKPETGMWGFLENTLNTSPLNLGQCVNSANLVLRGRFGRSTSLWS